MTTEDEQWTIAIRLARDAIDGIDQSEVIQRLEREGLDDSQIDRIYNKTLHLDITRPPTGSDCAENPCLCNVGVQECPIHPGRLYTEEEKIQFGKDWNARVTLGE